MKFNRFLATLFSVAVFSGAALADDHVEKYDAEVKKVMADKGKITLKHGELKSHNMPPMTMMFKVKEGTSLEGLQADDAVEFTMDEKMVIQSIQKVKKDQ